MIKQMGAKIKTPKKIPGPKLNPKNSLTKFSSLKIFQKALNDIIITFYFIWLYFIRRITQPTIFRLFRIPPKIPSQIMPPKKNHLPNFPTPKNPGIKNFQPQKIIFLSLSLEIRSTPQPPKGSNFKALTGKIWVFSICSHLWQVVAYKR